MSDEGTIPPGALSLEELQEVERCLARAHALLLNGQSDPEVSAFDLVGYALKDVWAAETDKRAGFGEGEAPYNNGCGKSVAECRGCPGYSVDGRECGAVWFRADGSEASHDEVRATIEARRSELPDR